MALPLARCAFRARPARAGSRGRAVAVEVAPGAWSEMRLEGWRGKAEPRPSMAGYQACSSSELC